VTPKVVVRGLRKRYGGVQAVDEASFAIQEGEIFGLLGPNGAGKTTTIECVIGLREPDDGAIEVCGLDARRQPRLVKEKIGAALQSTSLQDKITPIEALSLFGAFYSNPTPPDRLLDRFGLAEKSNAAFDTLSGGQRQRLALALAFVNNPELVFLDEPTAGLDPLSRRELHADIVRMKQDGHTVLLTTHYIEEAEALCDRVAIIDRGRIVASGTPRELIAGATSVQSIALTADRAIDPAVFAPLSVQDLVVDGVRAQFCTTDTARVLAALLTALEQRDIEVIELHARKATLEDVFLQQTARHSEHEGPAPASRA